jgi:23S rRNA (guanine745-N1)-methyltransferase
MAGQYNPVIEKISAYLESENKLLDVGCGEGSFVRKLTEGGHTGTTVGFDISKEGIYLATNQPLVENIFWCVADLANLPFANHSFDTILNIFSPSQYKEFSRVLKPDGKLIKIIPDEFYLTELRRAYFPENLDKQVYSNQKVIDKFQEEMMVEHVERITYTFDIPEDLRLDFLDMSPLEWSVEPDRKAQVRQNPLEQITIDVNLLIGTPRL